MGSRGVLRGVKRLPEGRGRVLSYPAANRRTCLSFTKNCRQDDSAQERLVEAALPARLDVPVAASL